jgi:ATP-dependent DNA helicase RecQ
MAGPTIVVVDSDSDSDEVEDPPAALSTQSIREQGEAALAARMQRTLRDVFGLREFRAPQQQVIQHVLTGGSGLVLLPTGGGKSLTYQLPGVLLGGVTLVVSPLLALMADQVQALRAKGIEARACRLVGEGSRGFWVGWWVAVCLA